MHGGEQEERGGRGGEEGEGGRCVAWWRNGEKKREEGEEQVLKPDGGIEGRTERGKRVAEGEEEGDS